MKEFLFVLSDGRITSLTLSGVAFISFAVTVMLFTAVVTWIDGPDWFRDPGTVLYIVGIAAIIGIVGTVVGVLMALFPSIFLGIVAMVVMLGVGTLLGTIARKLGGRE